MKEGLQHQGGEGLSARPQEQIATVELKWKNLLRDIETVTKELEKTIITLLIIKLRSLVYLIVTIYSYICTYLTALL